MQEQLSKNRIIIDTDNKGCVQASVTSSTKIRKSRTVIKFERKKIYLYLNKFTGQVPIMIVLKAMGMESDQEIIQMIGKCKKYGELLLPSIEDCEKHDIHTRHQALEFLRQKVQMDQYDTPSQEVHEDNYRPKCIYVVVMLRRMMEAILDKNMMDDKDYMGNKRLELSGQMLALLFEDVFKSFNKKVSKDIEKRLNMPRRSSQIDISSKLIENIKFISDKLEISLSTGYFKFDRFGVDRKGMTQVVSRLSYIAALGCMTKIQPQFENSRKVSGPRALQPSQWGMLCPCDTPVGESCGLVKNLALLTHVTTDEEDEGPIISLVFRFNFTSDQDPICGHTSGRYL